MKQEPSKQHLFYIDLLRVFLTILVFYHHSAIAFGASGGWYYKTSELVSSNLQFLLSINMGIDQSYFMSLFFFISAFLMPGSYDRKGPALFIEDRIRRLLIPLLIYYFIINPLVVHWIYNSPYEVGFGPMWFVFTLLLFEVTYVFYRSLSNRIAIQWKLPKILPTLCFILFMGIWAFVVRLVLPTGKDLFGLQLGYYPLYIGMYFLGIIAYRNRWLDELRLRDGYIWLTILFLVVMPFFLFALKDCPDGNLINGGWNRFAAAYAMWEPIMCVGICYFLLVFSKRYFNYKSKLIGWLSKQSYSFYIIHPVVLVGCTFLVEMMPVSPFHRLVIELCIGIPLCFAAGYVFRKIMNLIKIPI